MTIVLDAQTMGRSIRRMAHEIIEQHRDLSQIVLLGIETRGVFLARRLAEEIKTIEGVDVTLSPINIRPFRDDVRPQDDIVLPQVSTLGKDVIIVDDVLFTGRSVRACMDATIKLGRPASIQVAVLIDRGHRELPITANIVGKNIPTKVTQRVFVRVMEIDGVDAVELD